MKCSVKKRSISAPKHLFAAADERCKTRMFGTFSCYVRDLIRRDVEGKLLHPKPQPQEQAA